MLDYNKISTLFGKNMIDGINVYRSLALEIDQNPESINKYLHKPSIVCTCGDNYSSCLERTRLIEGLCYGDSGVFLATPGPLLAGLMLRELGDDAQKKRFFDYVEQQKAVTFLAVTEPNYGSNVSNMDASLIKKSDSMFSLNADKWLVGHGADADIGVLVARVADGPLGLVAILITPELFNAEYNLGTYSREHLDTVGLKGARLSKLVFRDFQIPLENILGQHLHPVKRGMMGLIKTFNRMRPGVAGFALGNAQAIIDYIIMNKRNLTVTQRGKCDFIESKITIIRELLYQAAAKIDSDPYETAHASLVKIKATRVAEDSILEAFNIFGVEILEHPILLKWSRDVWGYEYMEGTSFIHLNNTYQGYLRKTFL